jgi:hypothetical protein
VVVALVGERDAVGDAVLGEEADDAGVLARAADDVGGGGGQVAAEDAPARLVGAVFGPGDVEEEGFDLGGGPAQKLAHPGELAGVDAEAPPFREDAALDAGVVVCVSVGHGASPA